MIRDVTGLNEARDGSLPDKDAVGLKLQKWLLKSINIATKHINQASIFV